MEANFHPLEAGKVVRSFRSATRRVIFLDYGGTIYTDRVESDGIAHFDVTVGTQQRPGPDERMLRVLANLCRNPLTHVFVLSGKERKDLQNSLGGIQNLNIAAEAGFFYKRATLLQDKWQKLIPDGDALHPLLRLAIKLTCTEMCFTEVEGPLLEAKPTAVASAA